MIEWIISFVGVNRVFESEENCTNGEKCVLSFLLIARIHQKLVFQPKIKFNLKCMILKQIIELHITINLLSKTENDALRPNFSIQNFLFTGLPQFGKINFSSKLESEFSMFKKIGSKVQKRIKTCQWVEFRQF
jgi:hypothetical protein